MSSLVWKKFLGYLQRMSVRVASTDNLTLSGTQVIDGVSVVAGDLVLAKNQTIGRENGVYVVAEDVWSRSSLLPAGENAAGVVYYSVSGTINGKDSFVCTSSPAVVGTNSLVFGLYNTTLKFFWASGAYGDPTTGQQVSGVIGGNASYVGVLDGVQLTSATNGQLGYVNWDVTGFDFTKDFELSVCMYQGGSADGVSFGVGGSGAFTSAGTVNGGLLFEYRTNTSDDRFYLNGTAVGNTISFHSGITYTNTWMTSRLVVRTFGTKRIAMVFTGNDNSVDNSIDVTSWVPAGTWIGAVGRTGALNGVHLCNAVFLSYL